MLKPITQSLHVLLVVLKLGTMGMGTMGSSRGTTRTITRKRVSRHAAVDDTLARQAGYVGDPGEGSTVLADRREGRQGKHASAT